jgi:hypothetical protein
MHDVLLSVVLNAKIVHNKCEADESSFVLPIAWCELALCVACFLEPLF